MPNQARRVALVTGGGRGIGAATVRRLAQDGLQVFIADIDIEPAEEVAEGLRSEGHDAIAICADVAEPQAIKALAAQIGTEAGALDVLVNNASILDGTPLHDLSRERFETVQQINQNSVLWMTLAMREFLSRSKAARVVNVASILAVAVHPDTLAYATAKAGVVGMTRSLAVDLAGDGIIVNCICPGFVDTRMAILPDGSGHEHEAEWFRDIYFKHQRLPLGRVAQPDDIAGAIAFFCGPDCRYITGQSLLVDGGLTAIF